jgi:hypothetical protein
MNKPFTLLLLTAATSLCAGPALADAYLGGAIGQGRITASDPALGPNQFKENHTAFKLVGGVEGPLDVELEYIDFGKSIGNLGTQRVSGKLNGLAAFAVLPLPIPLPVFDFYGKVGLARLDTRVSGDLLDFSSRGTEFAWGIGGEFSAGSFSVRAEYERFRQDGRDSTLLSLGFVKYFGD